MSTGGLTNQSTSHSPAGRRSAITASTAAAGSGALAQRLWCSTPGSSE